MEDVDPNVSKKTLWPVHPTLWMRCWSLPQNVHEQMQQKMTEVDQGQQLNETPDTSNSSGQGYTEMGKVYKDPATGKLIMVEG